MTQDLIPLIDLVPPNHTDAQCRALLRSSRKYKPTKGRWVFTPKQAKSVYQYLLRH